MSRGDRKALKLTKKRGTKRDGKKGRRRKVGVGRNSDAGGGLLSIRKEGKREGEGARAKKKNQGKRKQKVVKEGSEVRGSRGKVG